ncbi:hypothetical protein EJB05_57845, partial [Eragrostis curvula]
MKDGRAKGAPQRLAYHIQTSFFLKYKLFAILIQETSLWARGQAYNVSTTIREDVPAAGDMLGACNDWSTARSSTTRERGSKHYGGLRVKQDGYAHECRICPLKALARHLLRLGSLDKYLVE